MAALSFLISWWLRLGDSLFLYNAPVFWQGTVAFTVVAAVVFLFMGLYRGVWMYASLNDLMAITRATTLAILIFLLVMFLWTRMETLPRSLLFINWFVLLALLGGPRFLYRLFKDRRIDIRLQDESQRVPVLLAGDGDGAELFIRHLARGGDLNYKVVGIVANRVGRVGRRIHGLEIMGTLEDLPSVVAKLTRRGDRPQRLILTKDDLDGAQVRDLLDAANGLGMTVANLPRLTDFRSGEKDRLEVRPIAIEDLLGRPKASLDRTTMGAMIRGRRVMVTGAGGSIGSELVRQISSFEPASLVLLDSSEFNLYSIDQELAEAFPSVPRDVRIGNVLARDTLDHLFQQVAPELVFHAAALKHVPLVEDNPLEGIATNVLGTVNVADACISANVGIMVMISTDKAVNPTSVMGASKRVAESYCQHLDLQRGKGVHNTHFVTVRFGNVLGSTGSVVPLFQRQLQAGGPLTVTHPNMKRYFMTISESVELVLQAAALGTQSENGECGRIHVLDMGEPISILDLARHMIRLAGLTPDKDVKIEIIGTRPGEKLFEEIFHGGEPLISTACKGILLAAPRLENSGTIIDGITSLRDAYSQVDREAALATLRQLIPEYQPAKNEISNGANLRAGRETKK
jgi:FlaA1/EpsC-like NDP-sugar epimerase